MKDFNAKNLGKKLKELRISKGMYQKNLAEMLKVKQNAISRYESGIYEPSLDILVKLAQIFDTSTDYLLGLVDFE